MFYLAVITFGAVASPEHRSFVLTSAQYVTRNRFARLVDLSGG
jgi:hypothetical protein